jgi:hypothetical protein
MPSLSWTTKADASNCSVHEVVMHQSPLTTKPVLTSKDISDGGNTQCDDSNNLGNNEGLHSGSIDFATELMTVDKAQHSIISD